MALALLLSQHAERHKEETNIGKMERDGLMPPRFVSPYLLKEEIDKSEKANFIQLPTC